MLCQRENKQEWRNLSLPFLYILIFYLVSANQIISISELTRGSEKCSPKGICTLPAVFHIPALVKAASFLSVRRLLHAFMYKSEEILDNSTSRREGNKPVSHSLCCVKWGRTEAVRQSRSLKYWPSLLCALRIFAVDTETSSDLPLTKHGERSWSTRSCRCRRRWWLPSWGWSRWCPAWPGCSPPYFPCLGFPFPHHCGECLPFSLEKSAVFVSDQSGASR